MIAPSGKIRYELRELVCDKGLSERVIFTGMIDPSRVAAYYQMGDAFVSASISETQGLTYMEALAAGLPLICRKDECLRGVVADGINGWQYTDAETFDSAVRELFGMTDEKRGLMRKNALLSSLYFSSETFAKRMEEIYSEITERAKCMA